MDTLFIARYSDEKVLMQAYKLRHNLAFQAIYEPQALQVIVPTYWLPYIFLGVRYVPYPLASTYMIFSLPVNH
jgi:hypothetical protein